jgi:molybdopterin-containing oxidoreductase family membrane subunit
VKGRAGVRGVTTTEETLIHTIERMEELGFREFNTYSPVASDALMKASTKAANPIRFYTLSGCILGFCTGLAFPVWSSMQWATIVGGKPVVSIPPFMVIAFELTVLFGGLFTLAGLIIHARLARPAAQVYDPRVSEDHFGIVVHCKETEIDEVNAAMLSAGIEEVSVERE